MEAPAPGSGRDQGRRLCPEAWGPPDRKGPDLVAIPLDCRDDDLCAAVWVGFPEHTSPIEQSYVPRLSGCVLPRPKCTSFPDTDCLPGLHENAKTSLVNSTHSHGYYAPFGFRGRRIHRNLKKQKKKGRRPNIPFA